MEDSQSFVLHTEPYGVEREKSVEIRRIFQHAYELRQKTGA